jgi:penicillin-binding protein 1A
MRLREAMVQSRNLVSVRLLDAIGVDFASRYITQFGFSQQSLPPNLSMSLGTSSLTPLSIARGYSVFANGGYLVDPWFIDRVLDRNGVVVFQETPARACRGCPGRAAGEVRTSTVVDGFDFSPGSTPEPEVVPKADAPVVAQPQADGPVVLAPRAIDERNAFMIVSMLKDVVQRGTGAAAKVLERSDVGGKTGSTNEYRDAWFAGFGGDLVTTVWVGKDDFNTLGRGEYGGRAALPIWIGYMREALEGVPVVEPTVPAGIITASINPATGRLMPEGSPGSIREFYKREDYERITRSGFDLDPEFDDEEAFDIF